MAHALEHLGDGLVQSKDLLADGHDDDGQQCQDNGPQQGSHAGAVGQDGMEGNRLAGGDGAIVAGDTHDGEDGHDQDTDGNQQVAGPGLGAGNFGGNSLTGAVAGLIQQALLSSPLFRLGHGANILLQDGQHEDQSDGQDAVEVQANGLKQNAHAVSLADVTALGDVTQHGGQPAAEGEQYAPGGGGGVDDEGGLLVGHLQGIVDGAGDRAGYHAA